MPNLLPMDKALTQTGEAVAEYLRKLHDFDKLQTTITFKAVVDAYSKISAAQWELQEIMRSRKKKV